MTMFSVLLRGDRACVLKRFGAAGCIAQGAWREAKNRKEGRGKRILNAEFRRKKSSMFCSSNGLIGEKPKV